MNKLVTSGAICALFVFAFITAPSFTAYAEKGKAEPKNDPGADRRERIMKALEEELIRSKDKLKIEDYDPPYFIAYRMEEEENYSIMGGYGAIFRSDPGHNANVYVEVRVGDYSFDNTSTLDQHDFSFDFNFSSTIAPIEENPLAFRTALWLRTDEVYKSALSAYHKKKGQKVYQAEEEAEKKPPAFSKEQPEKFVGSQLKSEFDVKYWENLARELSKMFNSYPDIIDSGVDIGIEHRTRWFLNTEGSRQISETVFVSLNAAAKTRATDGMLLTDTRTYYARSAKEMPSMDELKKDVQELINDLLALRNAPKLDPYNGPAILMPKTAAVLFHEAVGHRLEGERLNDNREGQTFKDQLNKLVLPEFLDVIDDPTMKIYSGIPLNGFYEFDEEGVKTRKVQLIEKGILKNYLLSRTPVKGFEHSNGHGRAAGTSKPTGRMGVTIVKSHKEMPYEKLKAMLIEEIKRQNKPYGLILKDARGGSTNTSNFGYQAFKGMARLVYRVFPDGREELVRGVEMVGTPLASINRILATSDTSEVFNGFCGAESGYVPVSAIAPAILLSDIELQRSSQDKERAPILPKPGTEKETEKKAK